MRSFIILTIMILSNFTHGASRVGGGVLSNDKDKYEMDLAPAFTKAELLPNEAVRLIGPAGLQPMTFGVPHMIQVYRFADSNAAARSTSRTHLQAFLKQNGWQTGTHLNTCVDIYMKATNSAVTAIAVWGNQSGATLVGQKTNLVQASIEKMVKSIRLLPGACAWR